MSLRRWIVGQFKRPRGFFGRLAGWIMANRESNRRRNAWTVELAEIGAVDRVLELGCGPGLALRLALLRAGKGRVVGLDHSKIMLDQARARNAAAVADGRLLLHLGGLEALPALPGPFDRVLSANVAQFFPDKVEAYGAIYAVMAEDGLVATTFQPRNAGASRDDAMTFAATIESAMYAAGFIDVRTEELALQPVPAVCIIGRRSGHPEPGRACHG
ncbi:MAG: methyltransferase domain-containing protein [Hyphomicrobiales bacterium]|nr:methyltransferase domain-containing protein [Hyphomicrobiales bacterium]